MADPAETVDATAAAVTTGADEAPQQKKRRVDRREKLRKTALCKHFDKPGGCPFPNCRFAHGRDEVQEGGTQTLAAQRKFICEQVLARMEGRFEEQTKKSMARPGTMIERYYTQLFACDVMGKQREDHYVHMHSNRICVVGVAPTHPVMAEEIESIEFSNNVLDSRVSGKKKKGGQFLLPESILCHIRCKSGASYAIRSCMRGTLLEVNESLVANPRLLQEKPISDGYLVVVQPKTNEIIDIQESLLTKDEYDQYRTQPTPEQSST